MTPRLRATLILGAWIAGWILLVAALAGIVATAWPALPLWVVPVASLGATLVTVANLKARRRGR